jgi:hypothetical protein
MSPGGQFLMSLDTPFWRALPPGSQITARQTVGSTRDKRSQYRIVLKTTEVGMAAASGKRLLRAMRTGTSRHTVSRAGGSCMDRHLSMRESHDGTVPQRRHPVAAPISRSDCPPKARWGTPRALSAASAVLRSLVFVFGAHLEYRINIATAEADEHSSARLTWKSQAPAGISSTVTYASRSARRAARSGQVLTELAALGPAQGAADLGSPARWRTSDRCA